MPADPYIFEYCLTKINQIIHFDRVILNNVTRKSDKLYIFKVKMRGQKAYGSEPKKETRAFETRTCNNSITAVDDFTAQKQRQNWVFDCYLEYCYTEINQIDTF